MEGTQADRWSAWWDMGVRVLAVETWDESSVLSTVEGLADKREVPLWQWSRVAGLTRPKDALAGALTRDPETLLEKVLSIPAGVVVAWDLWTEALSARAVRALREVGRRSAPVMLVATAPPGTGIPAELNQSLIKVALSDRWDNTFYRWMNAEDEGLARQARWQEASAPGLEPHVSNTDWSQVGGLDALKRWAGERRLALRLDKQLPFPRGVLLYGIPGTGKSLSVKAWAGDWNLPLLRLDWAGLMARYVGQSESRLGSALRTAERLAPSILWLDEIDKAFGLEREGADGGVSRRLVGALLTWLEEHRQPVLLLATANDVRGLPAELLRQGRFDALFFVDLPDREARRQILRIHLSQNGLPEELEWIALADRLDDYSGADIAAVVAEAIFAAAALDQPMSTEILTQSAERIIPWARTLGDELEERRRWALGRLRQA